MKTYIHSGKEPRGRLVESDTPRADAAWHAFNESASAIPFRDLARALEREGIDHRYARKNAEQVAADALAARNRAEADRDAARTTRDNAVAALRWARDCFTPYVFPQSAEERTHCQPDAEHALKTIAEALARAEGTR